MAGDWIKVEKHTPNKPELRYVARTCGCTQAEAFLAWFKLWSYLDDQTDDGYVRFLSASDADEIGTLCGLGAALADVGWLVFDAGGVQVVHWERHNGRSAKRRASETERKRHSRAPDFA